MNQGIIPDFIKDIIDKNNIGEPYTRKFYRRINSITSRTCAIREIH